MIKKNIQVYLSQYIKERKQNFAKRGEGLNPKLKYFCSKWLISTVSKLMQLKYTIERGLGEIFVILFAEDSYFSSICIAFRTFSKAFERAKFLKFGSNLF